MREDIVVGCSANDGRALGAVEILNGPSPLLPATVVGRRQPASFVVIDSAGQKLAYVYFEEEPGRRSAAKLLTRDKARRGEHWIGGVFLD